MNRQAIARCLWLALPGLIGVIGLGLFLTPEDWLRIACLSLLGPYLLGASKLYESYAIRKTQRALLVLVPAALQIADQVIPGLIEEGGTHEDLKEAVREGLINLTKTDWSDADRDSLLEGVDLESTTERVMAEVRRTFDPFVLLDKTGSIRARKAGGIVLEPQP